MSAGGGDDGVTVLSGATVSVQVPGTVTLPVAIDAGAGADTVLNFGTVTLSLAAGGSASVSGGRCGEPVQVNAARGIFGAAGGDYISNFGTLAVSSLYRAASAASVLSGTQCAPPAGGAVATGIEGGDASDRIANAGVLSVAATVERETLIGLASGASLLHYGPLPAPEPASARATGIIGGNGFDRLSNDGTLAVTATSTVTGAVAYASGMVDGNSGSEVVNRGALTVTAVASEGDPANAVGIVGGNGKDLIANHGTLTVSASSTLTSANLSLTLSGGDETTATTVVESRAVGIDAGQGKDQILNSGTLTATSTSTIRSANFELNLIDTSHGDTSTYLRSFATGITGGNGPDAITLGNSGTITAHATSAIDSLNVEVNAVDAATGDSLLEVEASATGIASGRGQDSVNNAGIVKAAADAQLAEFGVNASFVDLTIADRQGSTMSSTLNATAVGIDTAQGKDDLDISHTGAVQALATSTANSIGVAVASEGVPLATEILFDTAALASIGITSNSDALGITAGSGKDRLTSAGDITATATSIATQASINVGVAVFDFKLPTPGLVLGSAGTGADAAAGGIDTGYGNDQILSSGKVDVDANATAAATTVSVNIAELSVDFLEGVPGIPLGASLVVADTATEARANAIGITTGAGHDTFLNTGIVETNADADSGSTSVTATLNMKFKEGDNFLALNAVVGRAVTEATATAVGIDGGSGRDELRNEGSTTVGALADANAVAIGVDVAGTLQGKGGAVSVALTDSSSEGTASATGMHGGDDDDSIANTGALGVTATADVDSVSVSATVGIAKQGLVAGAALARSESIATATATGIDGGQGGDDIVNSATLSAKADADADSVAVSATIEGTAKGLEGGVALADVGTTAIATATGIRAGSETARGDDGQYGQDNGCHGCRPEASVTNSGAISVDADANTDTVSISAKIGVAKEGAALGAALARTASTSASSATGIEADARNDDIANTGSISLRSAADADAVSVALTVEGTASGLVAGAALANASVNASARAEGIGAGAGDDRIANSGSIGSQEIKSTATAVSVAPSVLIAKEGAALGASLADTSATAVSVAAGISAGAGDDAVQNAGDIGLSHVSASADAVSVSLEVALAKEGLAVGAALANSDSAAYMTAIGIDGGKGDDLLVNDKGITLQHLQADADAVSVAVTLAGAKDGVALGAALVDADATAAAVATGLAGGDGRDTLANNGSILLDDIKANADATGVSVGFTFAKEGLAIAAALAETGAKSNSAASALAGGAGSDELFNDGTVMLSNVRAEADAVSVSVGLAGANDGVAIAVGLADASGTAEVAARGLDGGTGDDLIVNRGRLTATAITADGDASGISVELAGANAGVAAGVTIADTSATSRANASGIEGGDGADGLWNKGEIALTQVLSDADAVSISVSLNATLSGGVAGGAALGRAQATAESRAAGMDGGAGDDWLANKGTITVDDIKADTNAVGVSAQLGVTNAGVAIGAALVDTAATARSFASGLDGGAGDDQLINSGSVTLRNIKAEADAVSVGVTMNAAISGGVAAGVALTDGSGTAEARAHGLAGGAGDDLLVNTGKVKIENVEADAHATGVSVTLNASMAGVAGGAALADTSATARTQVTGLDGGSGDDVLVNAADGEVDVQGKARADAFSLAFKVSGAVGVGGGASITDASSTAQSTVLGIDAGAGNDQIVNDGRVAASARAEAESASISVAVTVAIGGDVSLADARSTASATAVGIRDTGNVVAVEALNAAGSGKHGHDHPQPPVNSLANRGEVTATASAYAEGTAVSVNLAGFALGETTNSSNANATGILTGDSRDLLRNEGAITATSAATTEGLAVAVTLAGRSFGDASSSAQATATGIDTGARGDEIENLASINVDARSNASAKSVSVGLIGSVEADASTTSLAVARGIVSGEGDDFIRNQSTITVSAGLPELRDGSGKCTEAAGGACGKASTVSVALAGVSEANAGVTSSASATGLDGGDGYDALDNLGAVAVGALARGRADGTSVTLFGASNVDASSAAAASASAMAGGAGNDELGNSGSLQVHAAAETYTYGFGFTLIGTASAAGSSVTNAYARGMGGDAGDDLLLNRDAGHITVRATTQSTVDSSSWSFAGGAAAQATLGALTGATGIEGGAGADWLDNLGDLTVITYSQQNATGGAQAIFGSAKSGSKITATTTATGIDAGDDEDVIHNAGLILVDAGANMVANTTAASFAGGAATSEFVTAEAQATAISAGAARDHVYNEGEALANVTATARTQGSSSTDLGGDARASGTVAADVKAIGVDGGAGAGVVVNSGMVTATAVGESWATHSSDAGVFFSDAGVAASSNARLTAAGIVLGDGENVVKNSGTVAVQVSTGVSDWYGDGMKEGVYARADADGSDFDIFTGDGDAAGTVNASATVVMHGIAVGAGDNYIRNEGRIAVATAADAVRVTAFADPNGGGFTIDGDGAGTANTTLQLTARGIAAADGALKVVNRGELEVDVAPAASSGVDADGGSSGDTDVFVDARVSSDAIGILAGSGEHRAVNSGTIAVRNRARASVDGNANGQGADGDGRVGFGIDLAQRPGYARVDAITGGIDLGAGRSWVAQEGTVSLNDGTSTATVAYADSDFTGGANGFARSELDSAVYGVRTRGGESWIENRGTINIYANPEASSNASGMASGDGSRAWGTAIARTQLDSRVHGILAEGAGSGVAHSGSIVIEARPAISAATSAESNLDGDSLSRAIVIGNISTTGIETLDSGSSAELLGTIEVDVVATGTASSYAHADGALGDTRARAESTAQINARAVGAHIASGVGSVSNDGGMNVLTSVTTSTSTNTSAPGLPKGVENNWSLATAEAFGLWAGTAQSSLAIANTGEITVGASSQAQASAVGSTYMHTEEHAVARAIGIWAAGEADFSVLNTGTILATASAASDWNNTGQTPIADAVGIRSGSGNDTIINQGTITATNTVNGVTTPGTAIDAGAGDDLVILRDGSVTNGNIDLGTGTDSLSLEGTPQINGSFLDELSTVSLQFHNSGRYAGALPGVTAIKDGQGTFTLAMLNPMERIEVRQGTLRLDRDYQFLRAGLFQAQVHGDGSHGQFLVEGVVSLNGGLSITRGEGAYVDGRTYEVLKANHGIAAGTAFSSVELPAPTPLLSFSVLQLADAVQVEAEVASFTTVAAAGSNQIAVAQHLDRILPGATGELNEVLGMIQTLSKDAEFATAYASLSPAVHEHHSLASLSGPRQYGQTLQERMTALRVSELPAPFSQPVRVAYDGSTANLWQLLADADARLARPYGVWLKAFALQGEQDTHRDVSGYEHDLAGLALGIDQRFSRSFMAGVSVAQARNEVQADIDRSDADIDSTLFALYGSYLDNRLYANGTLSLGRNDYDTRRIIVIGPTATPVTSTHRGDVQGASLGAGYYLRAGESWLDPFVNLTYTRLEEDGFSEDGSGAGLVVAARTTRSLVSTLGLRWSRIFAGEGGATWTPEASLAWLHDFDRGGHALNAAYVGAPDASFSIEGQPVERNGALLGLGISYRASDGLATFLRYSGEFRDHYTAHGLIGELRYEF